MKFEMPHDEPAANEQQSKNVEGENNPELEEEVGKLNEKAESVGEQLEDVDSKSLTPEGVDRVWENVTRVFGAVYMVLGTAAVEQAVLAGTDPIHQLDSFEKVLAVGVTVAGYAVAVNGFQKLIHGTKKFFEDLTPEQKAEISS